MVREWANIDPVIAAGELVQVYSAEVALSTNCFARAAPAYTPQFKEHF
jgi:hypothetical protein